MKLTNKEVKLVLRAIGEYEESIMNMCDDQVKRQAENFGYSESAINKISLKLVKQLKKEIK